MARKLLILAAVVVALLALCLVAVLMPYPMPKRSLHFAVQVPAPSSGSHRTCLVVVSNASGSPLLYHGDDHEFAFLMDYVSGGVLQHDYTLLYGGPCIMLPSESGTETVAIPDGATAMGLGLSTTSFTWRGNLARRLLRGSPQELFSRVSTFLAGQDIEKRTRTEWSGECILPSETP